jgi:hypothetical protein
MVELRMVPWERAVSDFGDLPVGKLRNIENLINEAYRRGRRDERDPGSLDNDGIDRRTYEPPNCGSSSRHNQHFHNVNGLKNFILNCPGSFGPEGEGS